MRRQWLRVTEVAKRLDTSKATVYRHVNAGRLPAHRVGTGKRPGVRIDESDLEQFQAQMTC